MARNDYGIPENGCECGHTHHCPLGEVYIKSGAISSVGDLLLSNGFGKNLIFVADKNTLKAADGITGVIEKSGFKLTEVIYDDLRTAEMTEVKKLEKMIEDSIGSENEYSGLVSVGTGSLNDICRLSAARQNKKLCLFATAPSMDGFASDTAPITDGCFKISYRAKCPDLIIGDTKILAKAPAYLKSAGFGDMVAKYTGIVDWRIAHYVSSEYYCDSTAKLMLSAADKIMSMADRVRAEDEETAGEIMRALIISGVAMAYTKNSRPASGAEHVVSHYWECKKLAAGQLSDFHGRKVGVATLLINDLYREITETDKPHLLSTRPDYKRIAGIYGDILAPEMLRMNEPSVLDTTSPARVRENWQCIKHAVSTVLPPREYLLDKMKQAGAAITTDEIAVTPELRDEGVRYHSYMRRRITLALIAEQMMNYFDK